MKRYNAEILSVIEVDTLSLEAEKQKDSDKIHIDECF